VVCTEVCTIRAGPYVSVPMASDRHQLWRLIEYDYMQLRQTAPEGFEPVVLVHLVGREEPVEIGHVETRDGAHGTLVRFEALNRLEADRADGLAHPSDYWVHVHESFISRVEISYRRLADPDRKGRYTYNPTTSSE
jgi:hypothetical protein